MTSKTRRGIHARVVAGLSLAAALPLMAPAAGAQTTIPGDIGAAGTTVVTANTGLAVTVNPVVAGQTSATGTVANTSGQNMRCMGANDSSGSPAGTVTDASIVKTSLDYYSSFPARGPLGVTIVASGSSIPVNLADVVLLLPGGSIAPVLGNATAARDGLNRSYTAARQEGRSAVISSFTVNNGATYNFSAPVALGANGQRPGIPQVGAFIVCTGISNGARYAAAGYNPQAPTTGGLSFGSLNRSEY